MKTQTKIKSALLIIIILIGAIIKCNDPIYNAQEDNSATTMLGVIAASSAQKSSSGPIKQQNCTSFPQHIISTALNLDQTCTISGMILTCAGITNGINTTETVTFSGITEAKKSIHDELIPGITGYLGIKGVLNIQYSNGTSNIFTYDVNNRVSILKINGTPYSYSNYDSKNNPQNVSTISAVWTYDAETIIAAAYINGAGPVTTINYNPQGWPTTISGGISASFTYINTISMCE